MSVTTSSPLVSNGLAPRLTLDGGNGNDTVTGSDRNDIQIGGNGNDVISGSRGNDTAQLGSGDDTFVWKPGDGSDTVDGQDGFDTLVINGGNVTMDLKGIERVPFSALGGADTITVSDLSKTDVTRVAIDLASPTGSGTGDGQPDSVIVKGVQGGDNIVIERTRSMRLRVNPGQINLTIDGGNGNDAITGSCGADALIGGAGNDVVTGSAGNNDALFWNPGDGSDIVEGQGGTDALVFNGSAANENIDFAANGTRLRLFRDVDDVTMDVNGVEHAQLNAASGADTITVNDLTGTDVTRIAIDLAVAGATSSDGEPDTVIVDGTADDTITMASNGNSVTVSRLGVQVKIAHIDAIDSLIINGLAGNDDIDASTLEAGLVNLTINGGDGDDVIRGSAGNGPIKWRSRQ